MLTGGDFAGEEAVPYEEEAGELPMVDARHAYCITAPGNTCPEL